MTESATQKKGGKQQDAGSHLPLDFRSETEVCHPAVAVLSKIPSNI